MRTLVQNYKRRRGLADRLYIHSGWWRFENKDNSQVALQSANLTNSAQLNNFGSSRVAVEGSIDVANSSITNVGYLKSDAIHLKQSASLINRDSSDAKLDVRVLTSTTGTSVSLQKAALCRPGGC